jgi:hypothetical protein
MVYVMTPVLAGSVDVSLDVVTESRERAEIDAIVIVGGTDVDVEDETRVVVMVMMDTGDGELTAVIEVELAIVLDE